MATTTFHDYTGDGSDTTFDYSFPTFSESEVVVEVGGVVVDNYTIPSYQTTGTRTVTFDATTGTVNATVCESSVAPKNQLLVRIRRNTNIDSAKANYTAGSSLKAADLTSNNDQLLRAAQDRELKAGLKYASKNYLPRAIFKGKGVRARMSIENYLIVKPKTKKIYQVVKL